MGRDAGYRFHNNTIDASAPRSQRQTDPHRRLAAAVMVQAVRDAVEVRRQQDNINLARELQMAGKSKTVIESATGMRMHDILKLEMILDAESFLRRESGTDIWHRELDIDKDEAQVLADRTLDLDGALNIGALLGGE